MHYLEDYVEVMKSLPEELQDGTNKLLMLDMEAEEDSKKLKERSKKFFESVEKKDKNLAGRDAEYQAIRGEYSKALSKSDDKVKLATQMHDQVGRYMELLDQQLEKLKMDLEADQPGSTALLEKRFHEKLALGEAEEPAKESGSHSRNEASSLVGAHSSGLVRGMSSHTPGAGSSRGGADDGSAVATTSPGGPTKTKRMKKNLRRKSRKSPLVVETETKEKTKLQKVPIKNYDLRSGQTFCTCDGVAYGEMVACDNKECLNKWFHYGCVGITSAPTGEWYCPICGGPAEA